MGVITEELRLKSKNCSAAETEQLYGHTLSCFWENFCEKPAFGTKFVVTGKPEDI
jgi:hypothetical protein